MIELRSFRTEVVSPDGDLPELKVDSPELNLIRPIPINKIR